MPKDSFSHLTIPITGPFIRGEHLAPSDDDLAEVTQAILIGGAGTLDVVFRDSSAPVAFDVENGQYFPFVIRRVTTATSAVVIGLFAG